MSSLASTKWVSVRGPIFLDDFFFNEDVLAASAVRASILLAGEVARLRGVESLDFWGVLVGVAEDLDLEFGLDEEADLSGLSALTLGAFDLLGFLSMTSAFSLLAWSVSVGPDLLFVLWAFLGRSDNWLADLGRNAPHSCVLLVSPSGVIAAELELGPSSDAEPS